MPSYTRDEITRDLTQIFEKVLREKLPNITPSTKIIDLGLDSLDQIEILMETEDHFDLEIGQEQEEEAEKRVRTFEDAINFVEKLLTSQNK
jgi:acyl carrier protein